MLQVSHISKRYRRRAILTDISFEAHPGECLGLIGANGCGKSTLLQIVSGTSRPDSGSVCWQKENLLAHPRRFSELIGYVPQNNPLFEDMTVMDHLKLWYSSSPYSLSQDMLDGFPARLGIPAFVGQKVSTLSGGMKKRLSLACALASRPPLVLLDEPAAALDLVCKEDIRNYIRTLKQEQKTILLATHEEADFALCDRLLLFKQGRLTELAPDTPVSEILQYLENFSAT